ncbi:restriction endonuclease subunit S [Streptomyces sp. NPDC014805]|uniref:methylation-associated defense system restriction endonuclease subunit S MAD5 n=1 Tax=Streptomyces sp. NPDC014805 TaxID=3364919 RepID=UPI0036FB39E7
MKIASRDNPVRLSWLREQGLRLKPATYLSGAFEARKLLERLSVRKEPLADLTAGYNGGIFNGPKFSRVYVNDPRYGVPFLGSTDMMEADLTHLPLLSRKKVAEKLPYLRINPGMTLISCSGTVGRMSYVRKDMAEIWSSQHVMKVQPNPGRVPSGYLHTFLRSRFGVPIVTSQAYGSIVQHIEPPHIAGLPVPRFDSALEQEIHELVEEAAALRAEFQSGVSGATEDLFRTAGLEELLDFGWHGKRQLWFQPRRLTATSLRALNYEPRAQRILDALRSVDHVTLGEVCAGGQLGSGARFKRIDAEPGHGAVCLIGQRQGFWIRPEGRWISARLAPPGIFAKDETVMIPSQGTLGENEVFCRAIFVTGSWLQYAYTQHFLRVVSGTPEISGAYLFALLRSEAMFRVLRSMSTGGKQQDIHEGLRAQIPVPLLTAPDRERIAETIRTAYRKRDEADEKEDRALELLEEAVSEHSKTGKTG